MRGHISGRFGEEGLESLMAVHGNAVDSRTKGVGLDALIAPQGAAANGVSGKLILKNMMLLLLSFIFKVFDVQS